MKIIISEEMDIIGRLIGKVGKGFGTELRECFNCYLYFNKKNLG